MTTSSDGTPPVLTAAPDAGSLDVASVMAREIERVANELFKGGTASPLPNALAVGAGGASPAVSAPPIPGPMHTPPLAAMPAPKESDLRAIPTQLASQAGLSPLTFVRAPEENAATPYFLQHAGLPGATPSLSAAPLVQTSDAAAPSLTSSPVGADAAPAPTLAGLPYEFSPEVVPQESAQRGMFDANAVKRDFPILRERVHGKPLVWLDNAATTQKPHAVIERISYFYEHENSNVHRAAHTMAARSTDAYEGARDKVRRFLNAPSPKQIVFVRGATEAINLVAQSWGRRNVHEGDEILITWLEHHANIVPWQMLASDRKARLRVAPVNDRGEVILEEYEKLLGPRTRLVAFTQVSNALGTIVPAREMIEMAHRHGARVLLDGAQAVSHMPVDVQALDPDWFVFSGHKVFAPTGIGVLYGKEEVLDAMPPWQGGGNMISDVTFEKTTYQAPPWRFEAGTGSIADAVGLGAALDYVTAIGLPSIQRYEHELLEYAESELIRVPGLCIIGRAPDKAGVISFVLDGVRTEDVGGMLDQEGIAVRSGHHCAQPILRRFGLESTVRASLAPYNTPEDIDALVSALKRIQAGRPPKTR
jgi:cysteine desulfurase / selenocysteine lyase